MSDCESRYPLMREKYWPSRKLSGTTYPWYPEGAVRPKAVSIKRA
jgi:hypothetical protein